MKLLLFLALISPLGAAELGFDSAFSSGMVLQRSSAITVSGSAPSGETVMVSLGSQKLTTSVAADGKWKAEFPPMSSGGPYSLELSDDKAKVSLDDVLVGDVWVCSGQSNMQMGLDEAIDGPAAIAMASKETTIRLLSMPKAGADQPRADVGAKWQHCSPESMMKFSAVGYFFAHHLHKDPVFQNVPLGIIDTSFGGTSIEAWTPKGTLPDIPKEKLSASMFGIPSGNLFDGMIAPLTACPIKGVIWYQGEANAGQPAVYSTLLGNLIEQWRKQWRSPTLPFLIVQLPAFDGKMGDLDFGWLREAQARACKETPNTSLAVTYDTTDGSDLHPREKQEVGLRLALLAKSEVFGRDVIANGPKSTGVKIEVDRVTVTFDQDLRISKGNSLTGFALAGADGEYRFAKAILDGPRVVLQASGVLQPKTVRYAWGGLTNANLANEDGLPAQPFRTDDFAPQSFVFQPLPVFQRMETQVYQLETGRLGSITSLVVRGKQFLSNEPDGGTCIPTFFGPRNLARTTFAGPQRLSLSDGEATLEVACRESEMTWTLTNRGNNPIELHIALASEVKVRAQGRSAILSRDKSRIQLEGIDRVEDHRLVAKAPANGSCILGFSFKNP